MKLLRKRVAAAAAKAKQRRQQRGPAIGIVWTGDVELLEPRPDGAVVVEDVHIVSAPGEPEEWRVVERVSRGEGDLGDVYGAGGELLGRVVEISGSLVTWREVDPDPAKARAAS